MGIATEMRGLCEDIVASHDVRARAIRELVSDTHRTLKGFEADRKDWAHKQAKALADFVKDLKNDVVNMIRGFQKEHKEMADELRDNLEKGEQNRIKGEQDRIKTFKDMMGNIRKDIKQIETYVANKLKEFSDAHADMSEELKKELAKYVAGIVSETNKLLKGYTEERERMAANWQSLNATMAKKRGVAPKARVEVKAKVKKEVVEEAKPLDDGTRPIEERVLEFIERHPAGTKVGDMEQSLGVPRVRLGVIAKKLLEEDKVRKEENIYFPL